MLEWWIERVDPNSLNELCIAPHGEYPLDIPSKIFDLPHVSMFIFEYFWYNTFSVPKLQNTEYYGALFFLNRPISSIVYCNSKFFFLFGQN